MTDSPDARTRFSRQLDKATRILALRDHSEAELRRKLLQSSERAARRDAAGDNGEPAIDEETLERVIRWCQQQGWQDDTRFTERFIASRSRKGFGPQRIRMELSQRGVDRNLADAAMAECGIDWQACTAAAAEKKFGFPLPTSWPEKAKIQRFLLSKGFLNEDIREIYRNFAD
ncbi:regulatory protein RecX [Pantoea sp. 1.19]|uniref:regulatory protein RecX n=1 Tax=Pantoea sp. 1.19 TaxID=1925589 RepID=UPI000948D90B|nr:regulatory protein RecX [Pantoea sp. 1.19]